MNLSDRDVRGQYADIALDKDRMQSYWAIRDQQMLASREEVLLFHRFGRELLSLRRRTPPASEQEISGLTKLYRLKARDVMPAMHFAAWMPTEAEVEALLDRRGPDDMMVTWDHIRVLSMLEKPRREELLEEVLKRGLSPGTLQAKLRRRRRESEPPQFSIPVDAFTALKYIPILGNNLVSRWINDITWMEGVFADGVGGPRGEKLISKIREGQASLIKFSDDAQRLAQRLGGLADQLDAQRAEIESQLGGEASQ